MTGAVDKVRAAQQAVYDAEAARGAVIRESFPLGSWVFWRHGDHERSGVVIGHGSCEVKVRSPRGSEYWQDARAITRVAS